MNTGRSPTISWSASARRYRFSELGGEGDEIAEIDRAVLVQVEARVEAIARRDTAEIRGETGISQTLPPLFAPNGGVYATRRSTLIEQGRLIGDDCYGHVMSRTRSVDIDDPVDMLIAEGVAQYLAEHEEE